MKNLKVLSAVVVSGLLFACNSGTPQEKAENQSEKYEEKAYDAAKEANSAAADATGKSIESIIYSDMAASNKAIAQVPTPALSNDKARDLCSKLGKSIVNRVNASDERQVQDAEKAIVKEKQEIETAVIDKKITEDDKNSIFKYGEDCLNAANNI